ncbi:uncharacterized protein LOC131537087 isoform X2 [Onychostoma macrolepis]|uniref:Endonuclease/exonuclease/phosphatase domain-containing protein n=2 Tax=Onychostoma macrolepis TaxID=369639 RepID=A0A7J6DBE1_9TELE|nr:uncharacterized protein LOC131537087 isoform X2 [Onychostoma macrolepis]XP_058626330.1 uncharacterized protein LOC131537087 isoform X2 [Onychostoma macrolepis]XP_058626331.1 uncharacterized protein LOC131537087 isoform X2 [Onychostoma macrolepis]XP_058626332.1 uncharacterized protein LOC131537087 isoform X2 [Onychostoma macrolepis]KAF4116519.1 hypothetical protein G5714_004008 [Onychostoma macrolepis]
MGVADELCDELFRWIYQQEKCADDLEALATELEEMREVMTTGQLVGNTATVLGSATLVGTGIATFLTGGLAAPLLAAAAGITVGAGTATSLTLSLVEKWKSSKKMENAEKTTNKIKQIQNNIERLQKKLQKECESEGFKASSSDDVECEITVRILRAMGKRSGRDLPLSRLRHLFSIDGMYTHHRYGFHPDIAFFCTVSSLVTFLGYSAVFLKTAATKGQKYYTPLFVKATEGMVDLSIKAVLKGTGQAAGGIFGLILTVPDLIDNCEELIKNKHQTEASKFLKTKAKEIRETAKKFKKPLNELQEMLSQIPEIECHIDLAQEMFGSQIYTQGTICVEYKQTQKQDRKTQRFIFLCTKDIGVTKYGSTCKDKSGNNKNKRQKKKATSTEDRYLNQERKTAFLRKPPHKSKTKVKEFQFRLPKIMMSNVRSLPNKIEELEEMMEDAENFNSDLMFFTETWLNRNSPSISLEGYMSYKVDRDARLTQKHRGGGLIMLVNEVWATDVEVENIMITRDYELMVVSIIPNEHPEGAPPLTFIHVYIPGPNITQAATDIAGIYYDALEKYPGGPVFLLGDFNRCDITHLLDLEQYVTCPTRYSNTLDKCYGNVPGAYRSVCRPPLGRSDHNVIHLIPKKKSDESDPSKDEKCTHDKTKPRKQ